MWKRDQAPKPAETPSTPPPRVATSQPKPAPEPSPAPVQTSRSAASSIGRSVVIKGELSGTEDLTVEGKVEGTIELHGNRLTVGREGRVQASVSATTVVVEGQVIGDISATERISIQENGSVEGDLAAPSVAIAEGAHFRGSVDMQRRTSGNTRQTSSQVPASKPNGQAGAATVAH